MAPLYLTVALCPDAVYCSFLVLLLRPPPNDEDVAVLHELNLAFRFASHVIALRDGAVVAEGAPQEIVSEELMRRVFDLSALVMPDPLTGRPMVIPRGKAG